MRYLAKWFGDLYLEHEPNGTVHAYMRLWDKDYEVPYLWISYDL